MQSLQKFKSEIDTVLSGKLEISSDFCLKLLKFENERRSLLKQFPLKTRQRDVMEPTRALNPDFFPTYLLDENANAEKEEVVADNSKISEDFN